MMLGAGGLASSAAAAAMSCAALVDLHLHDTTILSAAVVPAGSFVPPDGTRPVDTTACRVVGAIKPTSDSDIRFEVWMPAAGWNGKFLSSGEGGFAGAINYSSVGGIADALRRGYAGGSTDTGHVGGVAEFAIGHPEQVIDYGYRAKHLQALRSKEVIAAFYGQPARHSYFSSCSNGGRQALMEIQRFPHDYDGVIVGAPANDWVHLLAGFIWNEQALAQPGAALSLSKVQAIEAATLASCDPRDGVVDGFVRDPRRCNFRPESLACPAGVDGPSCLTPAQITSLKMIMDGPRNPRTGRQIYPGYFASAAAEPGAWTTWITGPIQPFFGNGFFGRFFFQVAPPAVWDFTTLNFDSDIARADATMAPILSAIETNLAPFRRAHPKGRIIMWHGWEDPAITSAGAVAYYERVQRANPNSQDFFRLFMVPGMLHCGGGPGANAFGQGYASAPALSIDPAHDVVSALERWVEKGVAPTKIVAAKYVADDPAQGVAFTRPLCVYPNEASYIGRGSTNDAASFRCRHPRGDGHDDDRDDDHDDD
jgi:feruloyl esterase